VLEGSAGREETRQPGLLHEVSRSVFWNTALLPVVTAAGVLLSILVRRSFGLESGIYDVVLGVANSVLFYSSLGLAGCLPVFLPELQVHGGGRAASQFVWRLAAVRLGIVLAIIAILNAFADLQQIFVTEPRRRDLQQIAVSFGRVVMPLAIEGGIVRVRDVKFFPKFWMTQK